LGKTGTLVKTCLLLDTPAGKNSSAILFYFVFGFTLPIFSRVTNCSSSTNHFKAWWHTAATACTTVVFHTCIFSSASEIHSSLNSVTELYGEEYSYFTENKNTHPWHTNPSSYPSRCNTIGIRAFQVLRPLSVAECYDKTKFKVRFNFFFRS